MIPLVVVSQDEKKINDFIDNFVEQNNINKNSVFKMLPKLKEFSIDQIRDIKKNIIYKIPFNQLYILYNFHSSSLEAQNAFLKTLEEAPEKTQFLLVVNNYHKLLPTIISRSKIIFLEKVLNLTPNEKIVKELEEFLKTGNLKILASKNFDVKSKNIVEVINQIFFFFKNRIVKDYKAIIIMKEILRDKALVENNNLDQQFTIDHLLIFIKNTYTTLS